MPCPSDNDDGQLFKPDAFEQLPGQMPLDTDPAAFAASRGLPLADQPESVSVGAVRMHGMLLDGEDAARVVGVGLGVALEVLDGPHSINEGVLAMSWVAAALRDARALGACIDQMRAWTGYDRGQVAQLLGSR